MHSFGVYFIAVIIFDIYPFRYVAFPVQLLRLLNLLSSTQPLVVLLRLLRSPIHYRNRYRTFGAEKKWKHTWFNYSDRQTLCRTCTLRGEYTYFGFDCFFPCIITNLLFQLLQKFWIGWLNVCNIISFFRHYTYPLADRNNWWCGFLKRGLFVALLRIYSERHITARTHIRMKHASGIVTHTHTHAHGRCTTNVTFLSNWKCDNR